jgi:hypothetical protein
MYNGLHLPAKEKTAIRRLQYAKSFGIWAVKALASERSKKRPAYLEALFVIFYARRLAIKLVKERPIRLIFYLHMIFDKQFE